MTDNTPEKSQLEAVSAIALELLRKVTGLGEHDLRVNTTFEEIRLESLAITAFVASLEAYFPDISKTFIFDCRTLLDVGAYLIKRHPDEVSKLLASRQSAPSRPASIPTPVPEQVSQAVAHAAPLTQDTEWPEITLPMMGIPGQAQGHQLQGDTQADAIAIIGMQGQFPGAETLDEFWQNLCESRDSVGEIPADRWPLSQFFEQGTDSRKSGLSYAKWGGFIPDVDKFDAQFFGISAREAAQMDPQERIFLECAWHAMENAALFGERAENLKQGGSYNVGVFVGLTTNTYSLLTPDHWKTGGTDVPAAVPWSAANRVSFALNLSGPSMAVDTACSSSLVALHLACNSIANGECKAAIAGGVNLYFHPAKYIQLCQLQMLSPTGRCHTFGKDGDGFVPGEGVGAVILKPLAAAKADGDRILGVIRGTAVNHCGRTNGYTVPNAQSQAQLIQTALEVGKLPPSSISYIEAHGTGTKLGDPIEYSALADTLAAKTSQTPCGMGSVKSNIGHLESAAGIAGVIKVLLQLRHQRITPSLGSRELNPALDMTGSRFFVPQQPMEWQPDPASGLRRAGVSSFGAGGTNGHVIIEEAPQQHRHAQAGMPEFLAFPVSARSSDQLRGSLTDLLTFIQSESFAKDANALHALAYTLQCGRRHHPFRFVTVVKTREELVRNLTQYLNTDASAQATLPMVLTSHVRADEETDVRDVMQDALALARLWSEGGRVVWQALWTTSPVLIDMPLYPFARERHWINDSHVNMTMPGGEAIQPLSQPAVQSASPDRTFTFTGQEYFLRDHQISGSPIFPAAAYFDRFYSVLKQHGWGEQVSFQDITWSNPFRPDGLDITAMVCDVDQAGHEMTLRFSSPDKEKVYCRAHCVQDDALRAAAQESFADVRSRCVKQFDAKSCYPVFESLGMMYGPAFRGMQWAWIGENANEALVEVSLSTPVAHLRDESSVLEPGMLDGIFQSSFVVSMAAPTPVTSQFIPYSIKALRVHKKPGAKVFVHVKQRPQQNQLWSISDFVVFDPNGERLLEIDEFRFRTLIHNSDTGMGKSAASVAEHGVHVFQPVWVETPLTAQANKLSNTVIFDHKPDLYQSLAHAQPESAQSLWLVMPGEQFSIKPGNVIELDYKQPAQLELLWRMFTAEGSLPEQLIFNPTPRTIRDNLNLSWEGYVGLDGSKDIIEIIRSACRPTSSPRFHVQINDRYDASGITFATAIAGFLRAVHMEIPTITASIVSDMQEADATQHFAQEVLQAERAGVQEIKWMNGKRSVRRIRPRDAQRHVPNQLAANDVVVITGGAGAIARNLAETLAETAGIRLALIGRSAEDAGIRAFADKLRTEKNIQIEYWRSDCTDREQLAETLTAIRTRFGAITGVLHCAGTLKDAFFLRQDQADWDSILKAKVLGAYWLDELTQYDPIKWFALCSGLAGVRGNIGQSTYGMANAWLNVFAERRQDAVAKSRRQGTTMAIAWSLWNTVGGMQPPQSIIDRYAKKGLVPLNKEDGIAFFQQALQQPSAIVIPVKGRAHAIEQFLDISSSDATATPVSQAMPAVEARSAEPQAQPVLQESSLEGAVIAYLSGLLSKVTGTPVNKIDPAVSLEAFGLDSILVTELNDALERDFPQISKTVLFEARSLKLLAKLLIEEHKADALKIAAGAPAPAAAVIVEPFIPAEVVVSKKTEFTETPRASKGDNIAIIGIAGRYPGSSDLNELWQHLSAGHDLISEIPDRWDMPEGELEANPIYAKWGGFVDDFDKFDPLFFGISPRDAERMDPQERLFLQTAWHTLEDAGYTPESLSGARDQETLRRRVGVIVGVMYGEYQLYGADVTDAVTNSSYASIANRVSYCMDFDGPSFAIDSMCSSSLTSISLACDQLRNGRSDAVIAGGVNLSIHPHKYRMLCELNFASTDGRCRSFGEGGDGYVPGEGVGAVLLKRLEDAE
ncbi:MAG TPA: SDR family NAD(P)-dependent oxidoreductase, partial [Methylophilaceae bacterium]